MTHEIDDVNPPAPPSAEVAEFLAQHPETGAPSADQLASAKLKLSRAMAHNLVPLPVKPKRTFLPPELLAAAAVVMFAVLAQLIYLATRTPEGTADAAAPGEVTAAYRSGDLAGAQRLASSSCTDANCAALSEKLLRAMDLAGRINTLDSNELQELATLDTFLSGGTETELTAAIAKRKKQGPQLLDTDQLYAEARALSRENKSAEALKLVEQCLAIAPGNSDCAALKATLVTAAAKSVETYMSEITDARKRKDFEGALMIAEACIAAWPQVADCHRANGTTWASIATRDQSAAAMDKAKASYQRFLELADPSDPFVPKVKAILDAAEPRASVPAGTSPEEVYQAASVRKDSSPAEALRLFKDVMAKTPPGSELHEKAKSWAAQLATGNPSEQARAEARDLYLRGYQLKDSSPVEAVKLFQQVMRMTPASDENHQKAKSRIAEITPRLSREQLDEIVLREAKPSSEEQYQSAVALFETERTKSLEVLIKLYRTLPDSDPVKQKAREFVAKSIPAKQPLSAARELYLRGYQLKDSDPEAAKQIFRDVMAMTSPDSEEYEKAKNRLAQLEHEEKDKPAANPPEQISVLRGTKRILKYASPIQRVALGDPSVLDVRTIGNDSLEIQGVSRGTTTLLLWMSTGDRITHTVTVK